MYACGSPWHRAKMKERIARQWSTRSTSGFLSRVSDLAARTTPSRSERRAWIARYQSVPSHLRRVGFQTVGIPTPSGQQLADLVDPTGRKRQALKERLVAPLSRPMTKQPRRLQPERLPTVEKDDWMEGLDS